jgi:uncharacterized membrane protein YuzA (DUF378 family)
MNYFSLFAETIIKGEKIMIITNIIALCVLILGSLNWFTVGVFSWNFLSWAFGVGVFVRILYALVDIAGIWMLIQLCVRRKRLFSEDETMSKK